MAQARPILGYWNIRAGDRGNVNRYILNYAGVDFEDKRYDFINNSAEWKEQDKNSLGIDFPNLPYIIDGDFKLTESAAVTMYICDRWAPALMGSNAAERSRIIQLQCVLKDYMMSFLSLAFQADDQPAVIAKGLEGLPKIADFLGNKEYLTGTLSMVDFILYEIVEILLGLCHDKRIFTTYPALEAFHNRMKAIPQLAAYFASSQFLAEPFFIPAAKVVMQMPQ